MLYNTLDKMLQEMVAHDLGKTKQHALLKQHGYNVAVGVERYAGLAYEA